MRVFFTVKNKSSISKMSNWEMVMTDFKNYIIVIMATFIIALIAYLVFFNKSETVVIEKTKGYIYDTTRIVIVKEPYYVTGTTKIIYDNKTVLDTVIIVKDSLRDTIIQRIVPFLSNVDTILHRKSVIKTDNVELSFTQHDTAFSRFSYPSNRFEWGINSSIDSVVLHKYIPYQDTTIKEDKWYEKGWVWWTAGTAVQIFTIIAVTR